VAAVQAYLAGPGAAQPLLDHHVFSTSGSTGEPALFVSSRAEFACWVGLLMRTLALLGVGPHLRLLGLGPPSPPLHISRYLVAGLLAGRPSAAPRTSAETPLPEIVAACNAFQPQAIVGYPSVHALLASMYSTTEAAMIASGCRAGVGMHLWEATRTPPVCRSGGWPRWRAAATTSSTCPAASAAPSPCRPRETGPGRS